MDEFKVLVLFGYEALVLPHCWWCYMESYWILFPNDKSFMFLVI